MKETQIKAIKHISKRDGAQGSRRRAVNSLIMIGNYITQAACGLKERGA
jgi:hypothetical protein